VIVVNIILLIASIIIGAKLAGVINDLNFHKYRAANFEKQANEALAYSSKVERDNDDLRRRLTEQGKAWSAKLRKAQTR